MDYLLYDGAARTSALNIAVISCGVVGHTSRSTNEDRKSWSRLTLSLNRKKSRLPIALYVAAYGRPLDHISLSALDFL